jgi:hypothetical protein
MGLMVTSLSSPLTQRGTAARRASPAPVALALLVLLGTGGCAALSEPKVQNAEEKKGAVGPYLVLKLNERRVYLMDDPPGSPPKSYIVAVGRKPTETPTGKFAIKEMVKNPDWVKFDFKDPTRVLGRVPPGPKNPMGLRWIGFAMSPHGWDVGFHGTPQPELLGQAVSHGCVRMRNEDVVMLFDRVKIGTPVIVEP